jgi:N-acetyl-gamma-glutamyl-phosphate reductase
MRGISAALYIPCQGDEKQISEHVTQAYNEAYAHYPLVKHAYLPTLNSKGQQQLLSLKNIAGSCSTYIGYQYVNGYLVVFSMLDNLLKGAASQAIENANRILQLPYICGLENIVEGGL